MKKAVNRFYESIPNPGAQTKSDLIRRFVYFLTVDQGMEKAWPKHIQECFDECDLARPANVSQHLGTGLKNGSYIAANGGGYRLERKRRDEIAKEIGANIAIAQTSTTLRDLELKLPSGAAKDFLDETIDCFEAGANRAAIVMAWILTVDHLYSHILNHKLAEFNVVLKSNTDKRIKISVISSRDDFSEIPEGKFIEFCRSAKIISNDVRKILDQKLGTRNSSAHPSGIAIKETKVIDFIEDLVENIVLKYPS